MTVAATSSRSVTEGTSLRQPIPARAAKVQERYNLRYDLRTMVARGASCNARPARSDRRLRPGETMRPSSSGTRSGKIRRKRPADVALPPSRLLLFGIAITLGFAVMGFEMLAAAFSIRISAAPFTPGPR